TAHANARILRGILKGLLRGSTDGSVLQCIAATGEDNKDLGTDVPKWEMPPDRLKPSAGVENHCLRKPDCQKLGCLAAFQRVAVLRLDGSGDAAAQRNGVH